MTIQIIEQKINSYWVNLENYKNILVKEKISNFNFYQSPDWLKQISIENNLKISVLISKKGGKILSATPFTIKENFLFKFYGSPLSGSFSLYCGTIFFSLMSDKEKIDIIKSEISILSKLTNYIEYVYDNIDDTNDNINKYFLNYGFKKYYKQTSIIDIVPDQEFLWKGLESRARNMIRKSQKNNVTVKRTNIDKIWLNKFYEMLTKTFDRQRINIPHSKDFYLTLDELFKKDSIFCLTAYCSNEIVGKAIFLKNEHQLIYFSGTSSVKGLQTASNSLILWEAIKYASNNNIRVFDLGGIGMKSIDKFKKSFGGSSKKFTHFKKSPLYLRLAEVLIRYLMKKRIITFQVL